MCDAEAFWEGANPQDPRLHAVSRLENHNLLHPLQIRVDSAQYTDTKESITPVSWSPLCYGNKILTNNWESCFLVTCVVKRAEANHRQHGFSTWEAIFDVVDPDFKVLRVATRVQKFDGFIYNTCVDLECLSNQLGFVAHNAVEFCYWCSARQGGKGHENKLLGFKNFNEDAPWKRTRISTTNPPPPPEDCPIQSDGMLNMFHFIPDLVHGKHLGVDSNLGGGVLVCLVEEAPGTTQQEKPNFSWQEIKRVFDAGVPEWSFFRGG